MPFETIFEPEFPERARLLAERGATDREIAEELGVSERTFHRWKHTIDGFAEQLKLGKEVADERVEQSLYRRATGYTFDAQKVFQYQGEPVICEYVEHVPPDTTAAIFWLKNRRKDDWRDKHVIENENHDALLRAIERGQQRLEADRHYSPYEVDLLEAGRTMRGLLEEAGKDAE